MNSEELRCLIARKEDAKLDFKIESKVINGIKDDKEWNEFIKDIISIANGNIGTATETGYLIIGAGNKLKPDGTRDLKDVDTVKIKETQILDRVRSACEPRIPEINCELVSLDGKNLFVISIPPTPYLHKLTRDLRCPGKKNTEFTIYNIHTVLMRRKDGEEIYVATDEEKEELRKEKKSITSLNSIVSIDDLVEEVRSQCCDKIQHLYSKIKLLNLQSIDVDQLYVDVYLLEKISSETLSTIDTIVEQSDLQNDFDRLVMGQRQDRKHGFTVAKNHNRLMILGKPGSGKTTFLRHLAVACCQGEFKSENVPVFIELRSITNASHFNLFDEIHKEFDLPNQEQTKQILKQGKVLIFLDGLDEVPTESRRDVQKQIDEFSRNSLYYKNHFIITCRTQTTEYTLQNFDYVEVADFNPEQVEKFSRNWFTMLAKTHQEGEELTAKFLEKLRLPENKQIDKLAVTPILLSLTCWIFGEFKDLPSKRSQLYQRGINLLLKEWDEKRDIQRDLSSERYRNLSLEDKKKLLSYVAYRKFNQEQYALFKQSEIQKYIAEYLKDISNNDIQSVVKTIEAQHGLLIQRAQDINSEGIYSFSHLTFQEYFTAKYIVENNQIEQLVKEHLIDTRWREVFLLTAELMGDNAEELLKMIKLEIDYKLGKEKEIQDFIGRVYKRSQSLSVPYHQAKVRFFYFAINSNNILEFKPNSSFMPNQKFDLDLNSLLNYEYAPDCIIDYEIASLLYDAYCIANGPYANSYSYYHVNKSFIEHYKKITSYNYLQDDFKIELEKIRKILPSFSSDEIDIYISWGLREGRKWADQLRTLIVNYRDIRHDLYFWSDEHWQLIHQYYDANKLLVDCLNSSTVNEEVQKQIEDTLLLPIAEIINGK